MDSPYHPFRCRTAIQRFVQSHLNLHLAYYIRAKRRPPAEADAPEISLGERLVILNHDAGQRLDPIYEEIEAGAGRKLAWHQTRKAAYPHNSAGKPARRRKCDLNVMPLCDYRLTDALRLAGD